jgi:hypothetical protein
VSELIEIPQCDFCKLPSVEIVQVCAEHLPARNTKAERLGWPITTKDLARELRHLAERGIWSDDEPHPVEYHNGFKAALIHAAIAVEALAGDSVRR